MWILFGMIILELLILMHVNLCVSIHDALGKLYSVVFDLTQIQFRFV